jgi:hypothetical protein
MIFFFRDLTAKTFFKNQLTNNLPLLLFTLSEAIPLSTKTKKNHKMTTNEIKKGTRFRLRNGWEATMEDNRKGNTRMATVEGIFTEMGSVYAHDIVSVLIDHTWQPVTKTDKQAKCRALNAALFGD